MEKRREKFQGLQLRTKHLVKRLRTIRRLALRPQSDHFPDWQITLLVIFSLNIILFIGLDSHYLSQLQAPAPPSSHEPTTALKELSPAEKLRFATDRVLAEFGVSLAWIEEREHARIVRLPSTLNAAMLQERLMTCIRENAGRVIASPHNRLEFSYAMPGQTLETIRLAPEAHRADAQGKIVIVIDDFGYRNGRLVSQFMRLPFVVTYAIIPGLPHSRDIARKLARSGKTMIVHMPMEAMERQVETNGYELRVGMSSTEIRSRVRKAMALLPQAVGMNNHMGSRATQDEGLLQVLCEELKAADWCFLDSRTIETTKAYSMAAANGLDAALNDTFLDSIEEPEAVRKKIRRLADLAEERGSAIGIGHPYQITLQALLEIVPELQQRGFEFITLEQLLRPNLHVTPLPPQPSLARRNG